jgi:hypothetical protein
MMSLRCTPILAVALAAPLFSASLDLTRAVVVVPPSFNALEKKAALMLVEEAEKRTRIHWDCVPAASAGQAAIVLERAASGALEGFRVRSREVSGVPLVTISGNDSRGVLYGVGWLLRKLRMSRDQVTLPADLDVATAPHYALRSHQLGYRPKTNAYDAWTVPMWEQYIRDLAVFGANAIELLPPVTDDDADSPHFPLPPMRMMVEMSRLADSYGMDVGIWYPAMEKDYSDPATVERAVREWGEVLRRLPRVDAVFVPGGDPGHTQPKYLMALLEKQAANLHKYHPKAGMWVSPQGFTSAWMDEFISILRHQQPDWLSGVVHGPQVPVSIQRLRELVPKKYPIRNYPDITHSHHCQFPVPDWDLAQAITIAREGINPRPTGEAAIFRYSQPSSIGFTTYSEGCNDDVNKAVWSALGWDPEADVTDILRDFGRYFIDARWDDAFAQGLLALERNWRAPLLSNANVSTTLAQFRTLERAATPQDTANWRFQQALYRAYYDAYVRERLIHETDLENRALDQLRAAPQIGSLVAMSSAERILEEGLPGSVAPDLRARVYELAEALFQSIRMQLSVERYKAIDVGRGASLDTVDMPLNNRAWLFAQFADIRRQSSETDRLARLDGIVNWTNPGPGGFYDDLGNVSAQPHLVRGPGFERDPQFWVSSLANFNVIPGGRTSWWDFAEGLHETPLEMHYTGLDPAAEYRLRVVYPSDTAAREVRLVAGDNIEIHPYMRKPVPVVPLEFDIPRQATARGELRLRWSRRPGLGGNGRGAQVAEVWLMKK